MHTHHAPSRRLAPLRRGLIAWAAAMLLAAGCGGGSGTVDRGQPDGGRDLPGERDAQDDAGEDGGEDAGDATGDAKGDVPADAVEPDFSLAVDPARLVLTQEGEASTTVTLQRTGGFDGEVELSAVDLPGDVSAAFDPARLGDGMQTSELTLTAGAKAPTGKVTITVRGVSGGLTRSVPLELTIELSPEVDVEGQVVNLGGQPVQARVAIAPGGFQDTDGEGRFSFPQTPRPYTLLVEGGAPGFPTIIYQGLTRPDPTVVRFARPTPTTATVQGSVTGGAMPADGRRFDTVVVAAGNGVLASGGFFAGGNTYQLPVQWLGDAPLEATLHGVALEAVSETGASTAFLGYGQREVTIMPGETVSGLDIALSPVDVAMLSYDLVAPGNQLSVRAELELGTTSIGASLTSESADSVPVLVVPGARYRIFASDEFIMGDIASSSFLRRTNVELGDMPLEDALPDFPEPSSPAQGATDVPLDAVLTWTGPPEAGVHGVETTLPGLGNVIVFTGEPQLDLASLPTDGDPLRWPAGTEVTYTLLFVGGFSSVDEASGAGERLLPFEATTLGGVSRPFDFRSSESFRSFTTAAE